MFLAVYILLNMGSHGKSFFSSHGAIIYEHMDMVLMHEEAINAVIFMFYRES